MVGDERIMMIIFQALVIFLLLLLLRFAVPMLHPILSTAIYLFFLFYLIQTMIFPFLSRLTHLFAKLPNPYVQLLMGSAFFYLLTDWVKSLMDEAGYIALGKITQFGGKIIIISLWLQPISQIIESLSKLISK